MRESVSIGKDQWTTSGIGKRESVRIGKDHWTNSGTGKRERGTLEASAE
jgi:hypothetical protein